MTTTRFGRAGVRLLAPAIAVALSFSLTSCEVKNPGAILDEDLSDELTFRALVTGMSSDFSTALDDLAFDMARGSDEMTGSGSYFETGLLRTGVINREDQNFEWGAPHRARWVSESGLERMREAIADGFGYDGNPLVARAFLFAAASHRLLAETACFAVIDGSGVFPHTVHFDSVLVRADSLIRHAQLAGLDTLVDAGHGLKAQAYAGLGMWAQAAAEAAQVPTSYEYVGIFSDNSGREENVIVAETHGRAEMSAWGVLAGSIPDPGDPRAPYVDCSVTPIPADCNSQQGADGETPHYQQMKYSAYAFPFSNIPVVKGTDMRLIEAEAALETGGGLATFVGFVNQARAEYGLAPLAQPATANDAWIMLDNERHLTVWMEARRWWDLRRWDAAGRNFMPGVQFLYGLTTYKFPKDPNIPKRRACIPISLNECQTNENALGAPECVGDFVYP